MCYCASNLALTCPVMTFPMIGSIVLAPQCRVSIMDTLVSNEGNHWSEKEKETQAVPVTTITHRGLLS